MASKGNWINPNDFVLTFRCTTIEYATAFIDKGSVKFNTPQSWVDYSIKKGDGRGDLLEGTIAFCDFTDSIKAAEFYKKYSQQENIFPMIHNRTIYFKDKVSMQLPCFCFYILKNGLFKCPTHAGKQTIPAEIDPSYFRDFTDNETPEVIAKRTALNQPVVIVIHDFDKFKCRLIDGLQNIGISANEVTIKVVQYENFDEYGPEGWCEFLVKRPDELGIKSNRFASQSEARIIVNSSNTQAMEYLRNTPLELGSMSDIAEVKTEYPLEGLSVRLTTNITTE